MTGYWFRGRPLGSETAPATLAGGPGRGGGAFVGVPARGGGAALHRVGVPSSGPSFSSFSLSTARSWTDCLWSPLVAAVHDVTRSAATPTCKLAKAAWSVVGSSVAATAAMPFGGAVGHRRVGIGFGLGAGDGGVVGTGIVCASSSKCTLPLPRTTGRGGGGAAFVCCGGGGDAA